MKILVLTPTRGKSAWFAQTAESVRNVIPGWSMRHVVIGPQDFAEPARAVAPSIEYITEIASGMYAALNRGIEALRDEDFVTWINDDDLLQLRDCAQRLGPNPAEADVIYGHVRFISEKGDHLAWAPCARYPGDLLPLFASGIIPFAQPGTLIRCSLVRRLGQFDTGYRLAGDLEYFIRSLLAGAKFRFCDCEIARFRVHEGQLSGQHEKVIAEKREALRLVPPIANWRRIMARWRFQLSNAAIYFDRVRRHGFVSMERIYTDRSLSP